MPKRAAGPDDIFARQAQGLHMGEHVF